VAETLPTNAHDSSPDRTERIGGAVVQHGHRSHRVYLLKPSDDATADVALLERLAAEHGYSKLFAKTTGPATQTFLDAGFGVEARIPSGIPGEELCFCTRFLSADRATERFPEAVREAMTPRMPSRPGRTAQTTTNIQPLGLQDVPELVELYSHVFDSYPFPIDDPAFLRDSMAEGTVFVGVRDENGSLIVAASAELSAETLTCELTDFATHPDSRGAGLASALLAGLESAATEQGMRVAYTIARATSASMNSVFARRGYTHAGTLVNNTHIAGRIESMNVWYRALDS
jgi:putative beta-lysine N-acetyltransferase